jgi:hypothetical protein
MFPVDSEGVVIRLLSVVSSKLIEAEQGMGARDDG